MGPSFRRLPGATAVVETLRRGHCMGVLGASVWSCQPRRNSALCHSIGAFAGICRCMFRVRDMASGLRCAHACRRSTCSLVPIRHRSCAACHWASSATWAPPAHHGAPLGRLRAPMSRRRVSANGAILDKTHGASVPAMTSGGKSLQSGSATRTKTALGAPITTLACASIHRAMYALVCCRARVWREPP